MPGNKKGLHYSFFNASAGLIFAMRQLFQVTVRRASTIHDAPDKINIHGLNAILKAKSCSH